MNNKETIESLYFEEKKNLTEISKILNVTVGYISKILKQNKDYMIEKERRKQENFTKRRNIQKDMIYSKRKQKGIDLGYIELQNAHEQAAKELSKSSRIGTEALRKWCSSAYKYNPLKKRYEFDAGSSAKSVDLPQYIKA